MMIDRGIKRCDIYGEKGETRDDVESVDDE